METNQSRITLNQKLSAIGFRIYFHSSTNSLEAVSLLTETDLEETLIRAAFEAKTDFRILSILMTWVSVHAEYVLVEKFEKKCTLFEKILGQNRVLDLMATQAVLSGNHKWKKLIRTNTKKPEIPLDPELLTASLEYQGACEEFKKHGILIPKKLIRIRESDVLLPTELAQCNRQYRNRLLYGASWRADIVTAIEAGVANPNQISRLLGCSYEPAYRVFRDLRLAQG